MSRSAGQGELHGWGMGEEVVTPGFAWGPVEAVRTPSMTGLSLRSVATVLAGRGAGWESCVGLSPGWGPSARRRLPARLRCLVINAFTTCAATGADPAPHPPCSHNTATTISGFLRGDIPTNQAFARSLPAPRLVAPALWLTT